MAIELPEPKPAAAVPTPSPGRLAFYRDAAHEGRLFVKNERGETREATPTELHELLRSMGTIRLLEPGERP